jgi:ficolin
MNSQLLLVAALCSVFVVTVKGAAVSGGDCGETFQTQLRELLATKHSCPSAAFRDCCQIKQLFPSAPTRLYRIVEVQSQQSPFSQPATATSLTARCDMDTDNGGWIVIQRRLPNGTVNFTRNWYDYENGFGDLEGEFWYGLKNIHYFTSQDDVELRIDMVMEDDGSELSWTYQTFQVAGPSDKYRLTIGGGSGQGQDAMEYHNGMQFSTHDADHDKKEASPPCAYEHQGGWWYNSCYHTNLNGPHETPTLPGVHQNHAKLEWNDGSAYRDVASVEMKIRPEPCPIIRHVC